MDHLYSDSIDPIVCNPALSLCLIKCVALENILYHEVLISYYSTVNFKVQIHQTLGEEMQIQGLAGNTEYIRSLGPGISFTEARCN